MKDNEEGELLREGSVIEKEIIETTTEVNWGHYRSNEISEPEMIVIQS